MRKLMDVSRLNGLGWRAAKDFQEGLADAYKAFLVQEKASA